MFQRETDITSKVLKAGHCRLQLYAVVDALQHKVIKRRECERAAVRGQLARRRPHPGCRHSPSFTLFISTAGIYIKATSSSLCAVYLTCVFPWERPDHTFIQSNHISAPLNEIEVILGKYLGCRLLLSLLFEVSGHLLMTATNNYL